MEILYFDETDSTNNRAKQLGEEGGRDRTILIADRQTGGRGRVGRSFDSPRGEGIYCSILLRPELRPHEAPRLTLLAALAVRKAHLSAAGLETGIKWPNDLVRGGKKLCGILTEMSLTGNAVAYVVVGIGINVHQKGFSEELSPVATSVFLETGKEVSRQEIRDALFPAFFSYYDRFLEIRDLSFVLDEYNSLLVNRGEKVEILDPREPYIGTAMGIDENGGLLVKKDHEIRTVTSGEVSVRGVYGYV